MIKAKEVLICDHYPLYRLGIRMLLSDSKFKIELHEACSTKEMIRKLQEDSLIDLIILDSSFIYKEGSSQVEAIIINNRVPVLLLCDELTSSVLIKSDRLGVQYVMLKSCPLIELRNGMFFILNGEEIRSGFQGLSLINKKLTCATYKSKECICNLTNAQKVVLGYLKKGMRNREIGVRLGVSENTVKSHVRQIFTRLKIKNRTESLLKNSYLDICNNCISS